jgi:preprotein translocase subunit SecF
MIKNPKLWMWISALTITVSIGITIIFPPVWGVDFIGGSLLEVEGNADKAREVQDSLTEKFSMSVTAQGT